MPTASATDLLALAAGPWLVVNDGVMGGRSSSQVTSQADELIFSGNLSLENNGGFASIRLPLRQGLTGLDGVQLRIRGDGRTYQLRLRHGDGFDGVAWRAEFATDSEWTTVRLPFAEFIPGFRGRDVPGAGPVHPESVRQIGLLLGDKKPGPFQLEISSLEGYVNPQPPAP